MQLNHENAKAKALDVARQRSIIQQSFKIFHQHPLTLNLSPFSPSCHNQEGGHLLFSLTTPRDPKKEVWAFFRGGLEGLDFEDGNLRSFAVHFYGPRALSIVACSVSCHAFTSLNFWVVAVLRVEALILNSARKLFVPTKKILHCFHMGVHAIDQEF